MRVPPLPRGSSPASPVENTLLDTVTLSSGTLAPSPVARHPFMGKLMSVAPLAGSLWMLRTAVGAAGKREQRQGQWLHDLQPRPWDATVGPGVQDYHSGHSQLRGTGGIAW